MRPELVIKSRSLGGTTDLTLLAPIKRGLVPSLESVTYKTRVKRVLATLNAGRSSSHEYSLLRPFTDAAERVGMIHSVRIAIVERDDAKGDPADEPDKILLAVTFDGGADSYIRVLWQKIGTLLDLIFCNTDGYVTACGEDGKGGRYEAWASWIQSVQIETDFFYTMPAHAFDDVQYLRNEELVRRQVRDPAPDAVSDDLLATRQTVRSADEIAWSLHRPASRPHVLKEVGRQGLRALVLLYRLRAYHLPGTYEERILHRAVRELLAEFILLEERHRLDAAITEGRKRFDEQITWLLEKTQPRVVPDPPDAPQAPTPPEDVQFGIISPYPPEISHGCLVLIAFRSRAGAARFLTDAALAVTREGANPGPGEPFVGVSITHEGLRAIGLTEDELACFPQEFREGMEARASLLGDFRTNHPRRWRLPRRNFPAATGQLVELSSVHAVVQFRIAADRALRSLDETLDNTDPLHAIVTALRNNYAADLEVLAVQPMVRHFNEAGQMREHFGFADGDAQPVLDPADNGLVYDRNLVHLGEFLVGYPNQAEDPDNSVATRERRNWLNNGSFLVIRKLSQDVGAFEAAVDAAVRSTGLNRELIYAKLMGRWRNGKPLVPLVDPNRINDFDYEGEDPPGSQCPFHAHVRRVNPRRADDLDLPPPPGGRTARLMRRGMSYGPLYDASRPDPEGLQRGLVFMAYNTSIAEQFEVVQRWISGGNSTGGYSGQSDPLLGVAPNMQQRFFRFEHENKVYRIALDGSTAPLGDPGAFVRLEWGAYLFTPSIGALAKLADTAGKRAGDADVPAWREKTARERLDQLLALPSASPKEKEAAQDAWKAALEDPEAQRRFESAALWAEIRKRGGVLRTPYGVIVASRKLIDEVLGDRDGYSVSGYHDRMTGTIGDIFLGEDDDGTGTCNYRKWSDAANRAIGAITKSEAFTCARDAAEAEIARLAANEKKLAAGFGETHWELSLEVREIVDKVLEVLCQKWFGLPEKPCAEIAPGGSRWDWKPGQPVFYPGHFTAPSRYFFQPWPRASVEKYGQDHGRALRDSFRRLVARHRAPGNSVFKPAPVSDEILKAFSDDDLAGRTIAGAIMGFVPTLDGNLRLTLNEWLKHGTFWSLRNLIGQQAAGNEFQVAENLLEPVLKRTMQLRPSPELIWRTAKGNRKIGDVEVQVGEPIVIAIVSATHEALEAQQANPQSDVCPVFGGKRTHGSAHPTHACPGYEAAMGALLGVLSALLEVEGSMRPSLAPLALTLDGELPKPPVEQPAEPGIWARVVRWLSGGGPAASPASAAGTGHLLVADGDSWMSYSSLGSLGKAQNIAAYLEAQHDYEVENLADLGTRLHDFYSDSNPPAPSMNLADYPRANSRRLRLLLKTVKDLIRNGNPPKAILFSAAGTDVVEARLAALLNEQPNNDALNKKAVELAVEGQLQCWLIRVLERITAECRFQNRPIPVFIHGYDYPVPDCRWVAGVVSDLAWLYPYFEKKGYDKKPWRDYPALGTPVMKTLIDRLNVMQMGVVAREQFQGNVFHVDLRTTLSGVTGKYHADWDNELHPTEDGFTAVTKKFADALAANALNR